MAGEKQPGETLEGLRKARRTRRMFGRTRYVTEAGRSVDQRVFTVQSKLGKGSDPLETSPATKKERQERKTGGGRDERQHLELSFNQDKQEIETKQSKVRGV